MIDLDFIFNFTMIIFFFSVFIPLILWMVYDLFFKKEGKDDL